MFGKLGLGGIIGIIILLAGIAVIAYANLLVAAGIALVLFGLGLVVKAIISNTLSAFGMI